MPAAAAGTAFALPEHQISAATNQELVTSCDNEPSHVPRSRVVLAVPACPWCSVGLSLPGLACCFTSQIHPSAFLYAHKRSNVHLPIGHHPAHLTAALTRVDDHVQLVFRGSSIFSFITPRAGRAAALVSATLGKHFGPHTPQWAVGRNC